VLPVGYEATTLAHRAGRWPPSTPQRASGTDDHHVLAL